MPYIVGVKQPIPFLEAASFPYTPYVMDIISPTLLSDSCEKGAGVSTPAK